MPIRIGGLASGMDIDKIVSDLMKAERTRVDSVAQEKTLLEWTRDAYTDVNKLFAEFILKTRESFGLTDSSSGSVVNKSVSSLKWLKSAVTTNTGIADVSARANAVTGSYELNVTQLAANWSAASSGGISETGKAGSNLAEQFGLDATNDKIDFTITAKSSTNEQAVNVKIANGEVTITKTIDGKDETLLDGKNISNLSLKDIADQINKADIGVTASYDASIDRFFLQTDQTGAGNTVSFTDESAMHDADGNLILDSEGKPLTFLSKLKLQCYRDEKFDIDGDGTVDNVLRRTTDLESVEINTGKPYSGVDAILDFGAAQNITQSSNQFTINNIDFDLKSVGSTTIKVDADEDAIVKKITEFKDQYNELIDKMDELLGEERYKDYLPLTDEQKADMSDKEVELWEEKAKSGLLRNDSLVSKVMRSARSGLYEKVEGIEGSFDQLTEIGISTERYTSGSMGGRLEIDETKLREAIREDLDSVTELLFKQPDAGITGDEEKRKNTGLVGRMYGDMLSGMKDIITKAGPGEDAKLYRNVNSTMLLDFVTEHSSISMLDESIMDYEEKLYNMELRLTDKEESYWKKFTAMETALNKMYSQSNALAQQLGISSNS